MNANQITERIRVLSEALKVVLAVEAEKALREALLRTLELTK